MKKIVLTGEFESSKSNLRRDVSKIGLGKLIKRLKNKTKFIYF
jgi:transposase